LQIASLNNENLETFVAGRKREETKHGYKLGKSAGKTTTCNRFKVREEQLSQSAEKQPGAVESAGK